MDIALTLANTLCVGTRMNRMIFTILSHQQHAC